MERIAEENFHLDKDFYNDFLPILTEYVLLFDRENCQAYADVIIHAGELGVEDFDFWNAVKTTLHTKRMQRYIPVKSLGAVIKAFAIVGEADAQVLKSLGDQVIKHKNFLDNQVKTEAKQGFQIAEIGLAEFRRALEDDAVTELTLK